MLRGPPAGIGRLAYSALSDGSPDRRLTESPYLAADGYTVRRWTGQIARRPAVKRTRPATSRRRRRTRRRRRP